MEIKVHCENCHTEWAVTEDHTVIDRENEDIYVNEICIYTCPVCHRKIECRVIFKKIPFAVLQH